jgi:hypothetical protein
MKGLFGKGYSDFDEVAGGTWVGDNATGITTDQLYFNKDENGVTTLHNIDSKNTGKFEGKNAIQLAIQEKKLREDWQQVQDWNGSQESIPQLIKGSDGKINVKENERYVNLLRETTKIQSSILHQGSDGNTRLISAKSHKLQELLDLAILKLQKGETFSKEELDNFQTQYFATAGIASVQGTPITENSELIDKKDKTIEMEEFVSMFNKRMVVDNSPSVMNRLCWYVEKQLENIKYQSQEAFDYSILKTEDRYTKKERELIQDLYNEYKTDVANHNKTNITI